MKRKIIIMSVVVVTFIAFILSANADSQISTPVDVEYEEYLERNWKMVELSSKLQKRLMDYYNIEKQFEDKYPEYYGGIYISDDAKSLVLQIVKDNIPKKETEDYKIYEELTTMDDAIEIEYVDNTFNELNEVNNIISEYMKKNKQNENLIGAYIDVMNNTAVVEFLENTVEEQSIVKKEIYKTAVLKNKRELKSSVLSYKVGSKDYLKTDKNAGSLFNAHNQYCSYGYRAKYNGREGFVTAGHCVTNVDSSVTQITYNDGELLDHQYHLNQKYDYAFIATNSSITPTNKLQFTNSDGTITKLAVVNFCPIITVNMEIAKVGKYSKYTDGKIKGLNQSTKIYSSDKKNYLGDLYGLVKSNLKQESGDSGGVVFIPRTDNNGGAIPIGILSNGNDPLFNLPLWEMYFTDISNIPNYTRF